jgi:hypothetical protein
MGKERRKFIRLSERRHQMRRTIFKKWGIAVLAGLILAGSNSSAFAAWGGRDRGRDEGRDRGRKEVVVVDHHRYNYRDGRFYQPGWFGFEFAIRIPPIGAVVTFLPSQHRTIVVRGANYYYYDNVYYAPCPAGYVVVPPPQVVENVVVASTPNSVVINVPNTNGSYTPVTLVRQGNGYVGPQGEYYPNSPTVEQLKVLYGK